MNVRFCLREVFLPSYNRSMKTREAVIAGPAHLLPDTGALYFDIETTGLSAYDSQLYLIGCCRSDGEQFILTQWFAEELIDEPRLLHAFFEEVSRHERLISYNGDTFDLRYLQTCAEQFHLPYTFDGLESVDLMRSARKLKKFLGFPNCRLKTIAQYFGIGREDEKSGGELIYEYLDWQNTREEALLQDLLLHNFEDIANLPRVAACLQAYEGLTDREYACAYALSEDALTVTLTAPGLAFPTPVQALVQTTAVTLADDAVTLRFPAAYGEHRHYYKDYKNYDYLPAEDTAMLRAISQFLEPPRRKRATAATCYTRHSGLFIEEPCACLEPDFADALKAPVHYALYEEGKFSEDDARQLAIATLKLLT